MSKIVPLLSARGVPDRTPDIDLATASTIPDATGGFADIFRARLHDGTRVAIKVRRTSPIGDEVINSKAAARSIYNWSKCRHRNIHELLGFTLFHGRLGMVSLWESGGDVRHYLAKNYITSANRLDLCVQICEGVLFLHGDGIVHGDIKGSNVLVSQDGTAMLTDFDGAELGERSLAFSVTGMPGLTLRWAAPELVLGLVDVKTLEADVYSLGMTILEVMTGKAPWATIPHDSGVLRAVVLQKDIPTRPGEISADSLWELLVQCWSYEPKARPVASHVSKTMKSVGQRYIWRRKTKRKVKRVSFRLTSATEFEVDSAVASDSGVESAPLFDPE